MRSNLKATAATGVLVAGVACLAHGVLVAPGVAPLPIAQLLVVAALGMAAMAVAARLTGNGIVAAGTGALMVAHPALAPLVASPTSVRLLVAAALALAAIARGMTGVRSRPTLATAATPLLFAGAAVAHPAAAVAPLLLAVADALYPPAGAVPGWRPPARALARTLPAALVGAWLFPVTIAACDVRPELPWGAMLGRLALVRAEAIDGAAPLITAAALAAAALALALVLRPTAGGRPTRAVQTIVAFSGTWAVLASLPAAAGLTSTWGAGWALGAFATAFAVPVLVWRVVVGLSRPRAGDPWEEHRIPAVPAFREAIAAAPPAPALSESRAAADAAAAPDARADARTAALVEAAVTGATAGLVGELRAALGLASGAPGAADPRWDRLLSPEASPRARRAVDDVARWRRAAEDLVDHALGARGGAGATVICVDEAPAALVTALSARGARVAVVDASGRAQAVGDAAVTVGAAPGESAGTPKSASADAVVMTTCVDGLAVREVVARLARARRLMAPGAVLLIAASADDGHAALAEPWFASLIADAGLRVVASHAGFAAVPRWLAAGAIS